MSRVGRAALLLVAGVILGLVLQRQFNVTGWFSAAGTGEPMPASSTGREILYWWDPMMPEYKSDKPGKSPMGMDMVPVYADEAPARDGDVVQIAPQVVNNLGVRTDRVEEGLLEQRITSGGFVTYDESLMTRVMAPVSGRVARMEVTSVGQQIREGDVLFEIESTSDTGESSNTPVRSPVSGTVMELDRIYRGMDVATGADLITIVDPGTVWIKGEVFESDSAFLHVGQKVEARFPERPGEVWTGSVELILPKVEYANRTVRYRVRLDNPDHFLIPNMFAELTLFWQSGQPMVHIPREALIRDGDNARVVLALGDGRFAARAVKAGAEIGDRVEIRDGLEPGEEVVTSAQFLIDSEASLQAGMNRMEPGDDMQHHHHAH